MERVRPVYPTVEHARAAEAIAAFFAEDEEVAAVLLFGSTARGRASRESCLDVLVLARPEVLATERASWQQRWRDYYPHADVFQELLANGPYSHVDLEFGDGCFVPGPHGFTSGPDNFELEIGNTLAYAAPLWQRGSYLDELRAHWLPYYGEPLRARRLAMVRRYCLNNLDHIPSFVERGLYFQSFTRFYHAFGEFLQALFIARRVYPIAYDKWIREQIAEILGLPELYTRLPHLFEIGRFESRELLDKAAEVRRLLDRYTGEP